MTKATSRRPIGIDLFAGAGGLSLGFEQAGFDVAAAVEIDPIHAATHKFNFPECKVIPQSVRHLTGKEIRSLAGLEGKPIDVVFGGPPCQGFSLIGRRMMDDPRNSLVREFLRLVVELDAPYFVFENVKGLTVGQHRGFLEELIAEFRDNGYSVSLPWRVLNACQYGVPQDRQRLFLLGARKGLQLPEYPVPSTQSPADGFDLFGLPACPTCADALSDLPDVEDYEELTRRDTVAVAEWGAPSPYARDLRSTDNAGCHFGYGRRWDSHILSSSRRTEHTAISRARFAATTQGEVEPISRFFKLSAQGISNTLRAGTDAARGAFTSPRPIHYERNRCVTVREMARLHGYPDWFRFHVTKWHGARQIGNSVPPPLARAVGQSILTALALQPSSPERSLSLGDAALLAMDMGTAARYWGIAVPIGRRDRKSGAKKRRQSETVRMDIAALGGGE